MELKDFSYIESLENAVKWDYFKGTLGWDEDKIAYEMNVHPRRLIEWVNQRMSVVVGLLKSDPEKVKAIKKKLEEQYPTPEQEESKKKLKLNIKQVVKKFKEGKSLKELATIFKVEFNEFRLWWNDNLQVINQEYKKQ